MERKTLFTALVASLVVGGLTLGGCSSILGDFDVVPETTSSEAGSDGANGNSNGAACQLPTDCASNFCVDGVCCEAACSGTCETCGNSEGKCLPVPDGQDPQQECKPAPVADAGTPSDDASTVDSGPPINLPDAGTTSDDSKCGGSCNGARACKFPDSTVTCGTTFCNTRAQQGGYTCDGQGHCEFGLVACTSYSCENNECRQNCAAKDDCLQSHFCNTSGVCQQKLADGVGCQNDDQCRNGNCVSGICCNSKCDSSFGAGASCSTGKCQCSVSCTNGGACRLFYKDADQDTFGNRLGSVGDGTAKVGCDNESPPVGFVADNTDCDDISTPSIAAQIRPNQTDWFTTARPNGSYDWNCSDNEEKQYREYVGSSCEFCALTALKDACTSNTTCAAAGQQSRLSCEAYRNPLCLPGSRTCSPACGTSKGAPTNIAGFVNTIGCGKGPTNAFHTCGTCAAAGGAAPQTLSTVTQGCH